MARSVNVISQAIKADFMANDTLVSAYSLDINKSFDDQFSSVSIESLLIYIFSMAILILEKTMDTFSATIDLKIQQAYIYSIPWYYSKVLEYQHGFALEFNESNFSFAYSSVNEDAKIVKYAAVREIEDTITKLCIYTNKSNHEPLTDGELTAFKTYMKQAGPAGIHYEFINQDPDKLKITTQVIFNPLILDATGKKLNANVYPVKVAIADYVDGITFGGSFNKTKLIDAIQSAEGVVDVILSTVQHAVYNGSFSTVSGQNVLSESGSFIIDTLTDTYTPNV